MLGNVSNFHYVPKNTDIPWLVHIMQSKCFSTLSISSPANIFTDYAIANNLTPFISMQNHYNLLYREEEREMFPTLKVASISLHIINDF
jgi:aryl-alcohol dehydrogenase-like predicted oxidoreductase